MSLDLVNMMFIEYGYNFQSTVPTKKLFAKLTVSKTEKSTATRPPKPRQFYGDDIEQGRVTRYSRTIRDAYQAIDQLDQESPVLHAKQIMSSPVKCLGFEMSISDTLVMFKQQTYRHMPVLSNQDKLVGIVSDRDILHYTNRLSETCSNYTDPVCTLMSSPVLTASINTDVRYIAKLFVLEHIGAMPVMADGQLTGIITRTDVMRAVMQHFNLELWV